MKEESIQGGQSPHHLRAEECNATYLCTFVPLHLRRSHLRVSLAPTLLSLLGASRSQVEFWRFRCAVLDYLLVLSLLAFWSAEVAGGYPIVPYHPCLLAVFFGSARPHFASHLWSRHWSFCYWPSHPAPSLPVTGVIASLISPNAERLARYGVWRFGRTWHGHLSTSDSRAR